MAATPFDPLASPSALLFDIYNDAGAIPSAMARNSPGPGPATLPGGPCGFVDMTPGANGTRCGCRRFWSRPLNQARPFPDASPTPDQVAWCMCSHHACFHEDVQMAPPPVPVPATPAAHVAGQENERPRSNREPLSPVQPLVAFQMPCTSGLSLDLPGFNFAGASFVATNNQTEGPLLSSPHQRNQPPSQPVDDRDAAVGLSGPDASLADTLSWVNQQSQHVAGATLPPIPSHCLLPSQTASTTVSSQLRYLQPFAGRGLNTLKGKGVAPRPGEAIPARVADGPVPPPHPGLDDGDATIPNTQATPSYAIPFPTAPTPKTSFSFNFDSPRPAHSADVASPRDPLRSLTDRVQDHDQRLERLENTTFSVAGHDDCGDKHDHTDLRVTELESRVEEVEKRLSDDTSTVVSSHRCGDGTASGPSASETTMLAHLQALQAQVNLLQASSLPTYNSPWELEVVVLPFALKGVWMLPHEFQSQLPSAWNTNGDEWTQLPDTHSRQTPDPSSPTLGADWVGQSPDSAWLLPRACAPGRIVDERLRSRGLIRKVSVRGSDARSVNLAVEAAFGVVLRALRAGPSASCSRQRPPSPALVKLERFLGLSHPWIPLRKLHKDSRLRFLSPAEMLTPTLWDAGFLRSSVVMKATGLQRLYVAQPEAYVQGPLMKETGWTWQHLRELDRVCPDSQSSSSSSTIDASISEDCWRWSDRLDEPPTDIPKNVSAPTEQPAVMNRSRSSAQSSSQLFYSAHSSNVVRAASPVVLRERRASRPPPVRTSSMPMAAAPTSSSPVGQHGRARVVSATAASPRSGPFERRWSPYAARPSPRVQAVASVASMVSKRRTTRSPSIRQRNTPRWSTTSMSRSPSLAPRGLSAVPDDRGMSAGPGALRGNTPLCYATPYSDVTWEPARRERVSHNVGPSGARQPDFPHDEDYDDEDMTHDYDDDNDDRSFDDQDDMRSEGSLSEDFDDEEDVAGADRRQRDGDGDIFVYEDEPSPRHSAQLQLQPLQPEDDPWPGIEDHMSDSENMDPAISTSSASDDDVMDMNNANDEVGDEGAASDTSSQPSEYPSTQQVWNVPTATTTKAAAPVGGNIHKGIFAGPSTIGFGAGDVATRGGATGGFVIHED